LSTNGFKAISGANADFRHSLWITREKVAKSVGGCGPAQRANKSAPYSAKALANIVPCKLAIEARRCPVSTMVSSEHNPLQDNPLQEEKQHGKA
jgi:hypothetical protein